MKTRIKSVLLLALGITALSLSVQGLAHGPGYGAPTYIAPGWMNPPTLPAPQWRCNDYAYCSYCDDWRAARLGWQLELSPEQEDRLATIHHRLCSKIDELYEALRDNRQAMYQQIRQEGFNAEDYQRLAATQGKLVGDIITLRAKLKSEILALLDEEQKRHFLRHLEHPHGAPWAGL